MSRQGRFFYDYLKIYLHLNGLTREYFPVKDEYFTVDRKPLQRYDEAKRKRFGFRGNRHLYSCEDTERL